MANWYLFYDGQRIGPMSAENLMAYRPTPESLVWTEGMAQWQAIYTIPELMQMLNGGMPHGGNPHLPPQNPQGNGFPAPPTPNTSGKDKTICGILAILLGGLGVQYFYLGKIGAGLLTILIDLCTCGLWSILTLVQGIMMLTSTQEDFDRKYVYTNKFFPLF